MQQVITICDNLLIVILSNQHAIRAYPGKYL